MRILLKLSGEALAGPTGKGFDEPTVRMVAGQIKEIVDRGTQVGVVIGGGNFWRGRFGITIERTTSDYMGMLATSLNALALQSELENKGVATRVQTAIEMKEVAEPYIRRRAMHHFEKGRVVIFACGTGNPYFSTDTAAALRAAEVEADVILFAKTIDAVYSADPKVDKDAKRYERITYMEVLEQQLKILDSTAMSLCMDNNIPAIVFEMNTPGNIEKAVKGEKIGTIIEN